MANGGIDWVVETDASNRKIGAIGFIGDKAAVVVAFYDSRDGNKDGKVSWGEAIAAKLSPLNIQNMAVTEVAMAGRLDLDVVGRDPTFATVAANMYVNFARGLIADGIYAVYFSESVSGVAGALAGKLSSNLVRQFVVRKGMEAAVKAAYDGAMRP